MGDLLISCVTGGQLTNEDVDAWVEALKAKQVKKYLAIADGALEMTSVQRKAGIDAGKRLRVALITDDRLVRGIATAASWFGVDMKAFPHSELSLAIKNLGAQEMEGQIMATIKRLREANRKAQLTRKPAPPR